MTSAAAVKGLVMSTATFVEICKKHFMVNRLSLKTGLIGHQILPIIKSSSMDEINNGPLFASRTLTD